MATAATVTAVPTEVVEAIVKVENVVARLMTTMSKLVDLAFKLVTTLA